MKINCQRWLVFSLAATVFTWLISVYWNYTADDAYISLRYAHRLMNGQGLTWTDGERVEG